MDNGNQNFIHNTELLKPGQFWGMHSYFAYFCTPDSRQALDQICNPEDDLWNEGLGDSG